MTGLAEAAKSRTPVLVLAGETPAAALTSNFRIDQHDLVESVGAIADRVHSAEDRRRRRRARLPARDDRAPPGRADAPDRHPAAAGRPDRALAAPAPSAERPRAGAPRRSDQAADLIVQARSAPRSSPAAARCSPTPAPSSSASARRSARSWRRPRRPTACSRGLPYALGISGGFASPFAAEDPPAGRRRARVRRLGQPLDDQARRDDRPRRQGDPDRRRPAGDRAQPPRRPRRSSPTPSATATSADKPSSSNRSHTNQGFRTPELAKEIAKQHAGATTPTRTPRPTSGSTRAR